MFDAVSPRPASCGKCQDHLYDHAMSAGIYEKALAASILRLKRTPHLCGRLRHLLATTARLTQIEQDTLILPVPLSPRRMRERGFNQAGIIGRFVAHEVELRIDERSLVRRVHTPMHRAGMDRKARAVTVRDAFEVVLPGLIRDKNILLVDDVFTSGETASSCAKILKESGAATVTVLTIAHAA